MGRTAAALRAWVWRITAAPDPGAVERRRRGRLERPEDRESGSARATEARDTPISPAWLNVTSSLRVDSRLASKARCDASR